MNSFAVIFIRMVMVRGDHTGLRDMHIILSFDNIHECCWFNMNFAEGKAF